MARYGLLSSADVPIKISLVPTHTLTLSLSLPLSSHPSLFTLRARRNNTMLLQCLSVISRRWEI